MLLKQMNERTCASASSMELKAARDARIISLAESLSSETGAACAPEIHPRLLRALGSGEPASIEVDGVHGIPPFGRYPIFNPGAAFQAAAVLAGPARKDTVATTWHFSCTSMSRFHKYLLRDNLEFNTI
jgi:hypothetical protein